MQAAGTTTSQREFTGPPPIAGGNTPRGKRGKQELNGSIIPQPGAGAATIRDYMPPAVKIPLRFIGGVQVDLLTRKKGECFLDDDSKLLKAMEDIYPVVSKIKDFKDNARWNNKSSIAEVFQVMLHKTTKIIQHEALAIVLKDGTYRIRVKLPVYFDVDIPCMPVYWIPELKKVIKNDLYELCFYLIRLMQSHAAVDLWEANNENFLYGNIEEQLAYFKTEHGDDEKYNEDIKSLEKAHHEYGKKGAATLFYNQLMKSGASKRNWLKQLDLYKPGTKMETDIYKWLLIGKQLLLSGKSMHEFVSLPSEYYGNEEQYDELPMVPHDCVKILWRTDDSFHYEFHSMCESMSSNAGDVPFFMDTVIEKPADLNVKECFPELLLEFLAAGRALEKKYKTVFSDTAKLKEALFKPGYLIDILV